MKAIRITSLLCTQVFLLAAIASGQVKQQFNEVVWPSPKEDWGATEYQAVKTQLELMFPRLPQLDDKDFGPVFAQLTNPENLKKYGDKSVRLEDRMSKLFPTYGNFNAISQIYVQAYVRDQSYSDEAIKLTEFMLLITRSQVELLDEMIPTLDRDDPSYATRMIGLAQTRLGVSRMAHGAIMMLGERDRYSVELRKSLAANVVKTWPLFVKKMDADVRDALIRLLNRTAKSEEDSELKKTISMIASLK